MDGGIIVANGDFGLGKCSVVGRRHGVGVGDASNIRAGWDVQRGDVKAADHELMLRSSQDGGGHGLDKSGSEAHLEGRTCGKVIEELICYCLFWVLLNLWIAGQVERWQIAKKLKMASYESGAGFAILSHREEFKFLHVSSLARKFSY